MPIEGMDEFRRKLERLKKQAEELDGEHSVSFPELFPPSFMAQYTDFPDIETMLAESPWEVERQEDFRDIPDAEWIYFVSQHTHFEDWEAMQEKAVAEWTAGKLGL